MPISKLETWWFNIVWIIAIMVIYVKRALPLIIKKEVATGGQMENPGQVTTDIAVVKNDVRYIRDEIRALNQKVSSGYVPINDFLALKARVDSFHRTAAYFLIVIGVALIGAIMKWILK